MFFVDILNSKNLKTHDFRNLEPNIDYFISFTESGKTATLTTAHKIKLRDKIILSNGDRLLTYLVEDLKSYWNSEIETALLRRIDKTVG